MLIEKVKPSSSQDKGVAYLAGIDAHDQEIIQVIPIPFEIRKFIYSCGSKFVLEELEPLLDGTQSKATVNAIVVLLTGEEALMYYAQRETFMLKQQISANLIKRQKKGGQSAVRFSRLAEESRHVFVTKCIDAFKTHMGQLGIRTISTWCIGSQELTMMFCEDIQKANLVKANDLHHVFATWKDPKEWIVKQRKLLMNQIHSKQKENQEMEDKHIDQFMALLQKSPDLFCFGPKEVKQEYNHLKTILYVDSKVIGWTNETIQFMHKKLILVASSSKIAPTIAQFGGVIGKRFYAEQQYDNDDAS